MFEQTNDDDWRQETPFEQNNAELERRMLGGANWFFWIAALSLINSIISLSSGGWGFSLGLGLTQIFDSLGQSAVAHGMGGWVQTSMFLMNLAIIGLFVAFGVFARKANMSAFITGFIIYVLDTVIYIFIGKIGDFYLFSGAILGIIIHAVALYFIFSGLLAARKLNEYKTT